jgi:hypothetical protein
MHHTGDDLRNIFGPKVIWISMAVAQQDAQLAVCLNPFYSHCEDGPQKQPALILL